MINQNRIKELLSNSSIGFLEHFQELCFSLEDKPVLKTAGCEFSEEITYRQLWKRSQVLADYIQRLGLKSAECVSIFVENRPEWAICFFGILLAGNTVVPLDAKLKKKELSFVLNDCQSRLIFVSKTTLAGAMEIKRFCPNLKYVVCLDETVEVSPGVVSLREFIDQERPLNIKRSLPDAETALVVYTSGTTGYQKGVELCLDNFSFELRAFNKVLSPRICDKFLSILPLSHMFEITCGFLGPIFNGACVVYLGNLKPKEIIRAIEENKITMMIVVPMILNLLHKGVFSAVAGRFFLTRMLFYAAMFILRYLGRPGIFIANIIFRPIKQLIGKRLRCIVCGAAALDRAVAIDFELWGIKILEGYGLTETSPVISVNTFSRQRIGSVGRPLEGVEVKILREKRSDRVGEIITRGPHLMKGYFKDPQTTSQTIRNGWLHTGDLGYFDQQGFLYIAGRLKNVIVTGKGKKVFPEELEAELLRSPYIRDVCVFSQKGKRGFRRNSELVSAVIVPDMDYFSARDKKTDLESIERLIREEVKIVARHLAGYKRIEEFRVSFADLPKTLTQKVKRQEIPRIFDEIEADKK